MIFGTGQVQILRLSITSVITSNPCFTRRPSSEMIRELQLSEESFYAGNRAGIHQSAVKLQ